MPTLMQKYDESHQHPVNRGLHAVGIPLIALSAIAAVSPWRPVGLTTRACIGGIAAGWGLLFLGHYIEGNRPVLLSHPAVLVRAPLWWARRSLRICVRR